MAELADIDTNLVTTGNPTEGGCVYVTFDMDAETPKDATTKMSTLKDFESAGEISENGFTESKAVTSNKTKGWHGSVVHSAISDEEHTFKLEFLEINRPVVAKMRFGAENVTAGEDGSVQAIKPVIGTNITAKMVIDELESNGYLRRTVIKKATIDTFDDVQHQRGSLMLYGCTCTAIDTGDGIPFETYRAKPTPGVGA